MQSGARMLFGISLAVEHCQDQRTRSKRNESERARQGWSLGALGKENQEGEQKKTRPEQNVSVSGEKLSPQIEFVDFVLEIGVLPADPSLADASQRRKLVNQR